MRKLGIGGFGLLLALGLGPARAGTITEVDVALELLIDVSGSICCIQDPPEGPVDEFELQRDAYVNAFTNILPTILDNPAGTYDSIAVSAVYWSGGEGLLPKVAVDWTLIDDAASGQAFIDALGATTRDLPPSGTVGGQTGVRDALDFAGVVFEGLPGDIVADRLVIDVSGDGVENVLPDLEDPGFQLVFDIPGGLTLNFAPGSDWGQVAASRDALLAGGIDINGLPILSDEPDSVRQADLFAGLPTQFQQDVDDFFGEETLLEYFYRNFVIGQAVPDADGPILLRAEGFEDFQAVLERKLIGELTGVVPAPEPHALILVAVGLAAAFRRRV